MIIVKVLFICICKDVSCLRMRLESLNKSKGISITQSSKTIQDINGEDLSQPLWDLKRRTLQRWQLEHGKVEGGMAGVEWNNL